MSNLEISPEQENPTAIGQEVATRPCSSPLTKRSVQSTLTKLFGAKTSSATRYASVAIRKGVPSISKKKWKNRLVLRKYEGNDGMRKLKSSVMSHIMTN